MQPSAFRSLLWLGLVALLALAVPAPSQEKDQKEIGNLIEQLGDDELENRQVAQKKLLAIGEDALPALRKAAREHPDADVKLRSILLARELEKKYYGEIRKMTGHTGAVRHLVVSKDGKRALTGSMDNSIRLWDLDTGKELKKLTGHGSWTWQVSFSPDEQVLSSGGTDKTLRLWDLEKGETLRKFEGFSERAYAAAISPDAKFVVGGEAGLTDGKINALRIFNADSGKEIHKLEGHTGWVWKTHYSPDGTKIASAGCNDYSFRIWEAETGKSLIVGKDAHKGFVTGVAWSPDGTRLLTCGRDLTVKLWDADNGKLLRTYTGPGDHVESIAFSKDGKRFLAGETKVCHVFETESGKIVHRLEVDSGDVVFHAVGFTPDGSRAVTGSTDNFVRLWGIPK